MIEERAATPKAKRAATKDDKPSPARKPATKKTVAKVPVATETKKAKTSAVKKVAATATGAKAAGKKAATVKSAAAYKTKLTPEERYRMVETTAYFIAERHGFQGDSTEHWVAAEREVAAKLG